MRMTVEIIWRCLFEKADTAIYLCCYLSKVLTVPNSANFRKGGDHLRIKDNMQKLTDNHTQKNQKGRI